MSYNYATDRGLIVPFTGNLIITRNDEGKIFRCDDTANVNRSGKTVLSTQYQTGSLMVMQRNGGNFGVTADVEYLTGGDFA